MKTFLVSFGVLVCLYSQAFAGLIYRQATVQDLTEILAIQAGFSEVDRKNLVVFPPEVAPAILQKDLQDHKFFVAQDEDTMRIHSLLKLFVPDDETTSDILNHELHVTSNDAQKLSTQTFDSMLIQDRVAFLKLSTQPKECETVEGGALPQEFAFHPERQVFVYYGGAYTLPTQRNQHSQTRLLREALELLKPQLSSLLQTGVRKEQLILIYGQVRANQKSQGMIHTFAEFSQGLLASEAFPGYSYALDRRITMVAYRAIKPEFILDSETRTLAPPVFLPENEGAGNCVIFSLKQI